jgi:hypothetical protein
VKTVEIITHKCTEIPPENRLYLEEFWVIFYRLWIKENAPFLGAFSTIKILLKSNLTSSSSGQNKGARDLQLVLAEGGG